MPHKVFFVLVYNLIQSLKNYIITTLIIRALSLTIDGMFDMNTVAASRCIRTCSCIIIQI